MARKRSMSKILLGVAALGGLVLFWPEISHAVAGAAGSAGHPGATGTAASGCDTSFIPGQRYVGAYGTGYVVVINGRQAGFFADRTTAEQTYNRLVCGG